MMTVIQDVEAQGRFPSASDFAHLYVGAVEPQYQLSLWYDLPYYKGNTNFYEGRISYHGVVYDQVLLRFDQLKQRVVVLSPVGNVCCLPDQTYIDWFEMDGHRYVHDPEDSSRYAYLLCDGSTNGIRLYHCEWKIYTGDRIFDREKNLKTLSTVDHFTLMTPDGTTHHVKRASDVAKLFPEQKWQIRQFASQNRLSFSKRERKQSLTKIVESVSGSPIVVSQRDGSFVTSRGITKEPSLRDTIDEKRLIAGIPVLDSDTVTTATGSSQTKTYIVPGVKKAKTSIADDQELAEIVVVGGRQSAVENMMIGAEKFKPQILKNIPSAFGESDIMKIVLYCSMAARSITRRISSDCSHRSIPMPLRMWSCSSRVSPWNMAAGSAAC